MRRRPQRSRPVVQGRAISNGCTGLKPERLVGDSAYGAAPMLNWLVEEKGIAPHIPVFDKSKRDDGTFSRSDFRYDPTGDVYHCPGGKRLGTSGTVHAGRTLLYRASKLDCDVCPLKPQCLNPGHRGNGLHEEFLDERRSIIWAAAIFSLLTTLPWRLKVRKPTQYCGLQKSKMRDRDSELPDAALTV
jgi:hypothetical protein